MRNSVITNSAIVILGASGDLAHKKLIPALSMLCDKHKIDNSCVVVGSGRSNFSSAQFREHFDFHDMFKEKLFYHQGIKGLFEYLTKKGHFNHIIFFFALPPNAYVSTAKQVFEEGFGKNISLIIEKPFGYNLASATAMNKGLTNYFNDSQIYRIDHYLAKEAVQNIMVFRFANALFSSLWNSDNIESIQINSIETIGVEKRGAYFDNSGIIRDMVQNHLVQLLCLLTMEAPLDLSAGEICNQKLNILNNMRVESCYRKQYEGYKSEENISPDSNTETYVEMKLFINTQRWKNMPIYIQSGKALHRTGTEISITFKSLPKTLYNSLGTITQNRILFKIQPSEGIVIDLASKIPGDEDIKISNTNMAFCYRETFTEEIPEAYQKLLLDALRKDRTLYVSAKETEQAWRVFESILDKGHIDVYKKGVMPKSEYGIDWDTFDYYENIC